ncbi:DnaD domain protein [Mammaliicoccus sciuri]|uniref:DnaD domain-containing protein n=1 Tax=Mammaliicoccus sciuri TaxID=1296 RepID=UPI00087852A6|nr:DnaD domain protein [Mammaliicoccus sciuri]AQN32192.1 replication initiation protein [Staphylococcus phage phi575]OFV61116.1 DNA replication protein DnaD [Mammaliicoccus sciuri]
MAGWISLHRSIENHWLYEEDRKFSKFEAWVDLLLMVNHKDNKTIMDGKLVTVKRGQRITSLRKLGDRWKWSLTKVDSFLRLLEQDKMIVVKKDTKKTLVTIVNYDVYQNVDLEKRHRKDREKTEKEHRKDREKTQKKTNNNDNKENNENNDNKENKKTSTVYDFYQESGFGIINQYTAQDITYYLESFENDSDEIVTAALKLALDRNKVNWGYAKAILKDWLKSNLKSISEVRAYEQQKLANYKNKSNEPSVLKSIENTPQWLLDKKYENKRANKTESMLTEERKAFKERKKQIEKEVLEWSEEFGSTT